MKISIVAVFSLLLLAASARAQEGGERIDPRGVSDPITIDFGEGLTLQRFLQLWADTTGHRFRYSEIELHGKPKIMVAGVVQVPRSEADFLFQSLLVTSGFAMVPLGPEEARLFSVEFIQSASFLKSFATFVPADRLEVMTRNPARVFTTSIQFKHVQAAQLRGAVQQLMTNRAAELAHESTNKTLVITGLGRTVASVVQLAASADVPENAPPAVPPPAKKQE